MTSVLALGRPVAEMGSAFPPDHDTVEAEGAFLTSYSLPFTGATIAETSNSLASGTWHVANCPVAMPFVLSAPVTVYQIGWVNGSSAGDNADAGIYSSTWTRLVSTGSTACAGNSAVQFVDVTDTLLSAGTLYYAVLCRDTITANRFFRVPLAVGAIALIGLQDSATTAFPLPDPLTNMATAATATFIPYLVFALRSTPI